jgi:hypothetical protein
MCLVCSKFLDQEEAMHESVMSCAPQPTAGGQRKGSGLSLEEDQDRQPAIPSLAGQLRAQ